MVGKQCFWQCEELNKDQMLNNATSGHCMSVSWRLLKELPRKREREFNNWAIKGEVWSFCTTSGSKRNFSLFVWETRATPAQPMVWFWGETCLTEQWKTGIFEISFNQFLQWHLVLLVEEEIHTLMKGCCDYKSFKRNILRNRYSQKHGYSKNSHVS